MWRGSLLREPVSVRSLAGGTCTGTPWEARSPVRRFWPPVCCDAVAAIRHDDDDDDDDDGDGDDDGDDDDHDDDRGDDNDDVNENYNDDGADAPVEAIVARTKCVANANAQSFGGQGRTKKCGQRTEDLHGALQCWVGACRGLVAMINFLCKVV